MENGYTVSSDSSRLQIDRIHRFLSEKAYWCLGIPRETLERAIQSSLCFGGYERATGEQVAFARVVTDGATFAWLCDVYVEHAHRGRGISRLMMENIMAHPRLKGLRRFCLATKDAHGLYERFGFRVTETPGNWMEIKNNEIYRA
jgi:GNAT superfamily N-acetyltransferase